MKTHKHVGTLAAVVTLASPTLSQEPPYERLQITIVDVKPAAVVEFEDYVKKINATVVKTGAEPKLSTAYQVVRGGSPYRYLAVSVFNKWEELDAWSSFAQLMTKAYGDVEGGRLLRAFRATLESVRTDVLRVRKGMNTYRPAADGMPRPLIWVIQTTVKPTRIAEFESYVAKVKAAQEKTTFPPVIRHVSVLGDANVYYSTAYLNSYAELDAMPQDILKNAVGEGEFEVLSDMLRRSIAASETFVLALRPDLSRLPTPEK
jgi:hypothetical protein